jgi:hypothetical protein
LSALGTQLAPLFSWLDPDSPELAGNFPQRCHGKVGSSSHGIQRLAVGDFLEFGGYSHGDVLS